MPSGKNNEIDDESYLKQEIGIVVIVCNTIFIVRDLERRVFLIV